MVTLYPFHYVKMFMYLVQAISSGYKGSRMRTGHMLTTLLHFRKKLFPLKIICVAILMVFPCSCNTPVEDSKVSASNPETKLITRRRADGTVSSFSEVNEAGYIHGKRLTFFADGKTVSSKLYYKNGSRHGPATYYYKNGQVSLFVEFIDGKREGIARRYYDDGKLLSESIWENDFPMPGLKEYNRDGTTIITEPEIHFTETDLLERSSKVLLQISCTPNNKKIKYYIPDKVNGKTSRIYIISENGSTTREFYVPRGTILDKELLFIVEYPTGLRNKLVKYLPYHLVINNK